MSKQPIGIFDSGVGGTSIWKEIHALLPYEHTIYLADSKNAPYGPKGKERIIELSIKNTELLLQQGCKIIVVACNTATTNAIDYLRTNYKVPFIGIEPAIKPAALNTKTNAIGILATKGTLSSALFSQTSTRFASDVKVIEQEGDGIVQLIEQGKLYSEEMRDLLSIYLQPMIDSHIDHLVLGCTHYPYLTPLLLDILPANIKIIDSGMAVARQTKAILEKNDLLSDRKSTPEPEFYTNLHTNVLNDLVKNKAKIEFLDF
ncbi:MAG: glutamate racemase [Bacteroidia bacterium]|nr:glutamate racemase [Bacteroidia bacterium]